jgi:hypothetical protein
MSLTTEDLQQIDKIVTGAVSGLATKAELDRFATKADLERFATKADLERFATKDDLDRMEGRLNTSIGLLQRDTYDRLDQHETRISLLEKALAK